MYLTNIDSRIKIAYLIFVSIIVLLYDNLTVIFALITLQVIFWILSGSSVKDLKILRKIFPWIFAIVFFYSVFVPEREFILFTFFDYHFRVNSNGFFESLRIIARFLTMLFASIVVRSNTTSKEFIKGLVSLKMPENFALILDSVLSSIEEKLKNKNKNKGEDGKRIVLKRIIKGDFYVLIDMVNQRLAEAKTRFTDSDLAIISAFTLIITGIRFIQIVPGFPIAPGYKNVVIVPLFIVAASLTKSKYTATYIGFLTGVIHFMIGIGRFGVLGILQFMAPGIVVDLLIRFTKFSNSIFIYALIGISAGLARVSALILLSIAFRVPNEFYLLLIPFLISHCIFGVLSAPVTKYMLKHVK